MKYEKLKVDFKIPEDIEKMIDQFLYHINNEDGFSEDYYRSELSFMLKEFNIKLTKEQIDILQEYYVDGGIYTDGKYPWRGKEKVDTSHV